MVERLASLGPGAHFRLGRGPESPQLNLGVRRTRARTEWILEQASSDARGEPWWVEDLFTRAQVPGPELLPQVTTGARAAVGCAGDTTPRRADAPGLVAPEEGRRLT
jgi:hypothetical protein